jgi:hypothetical protein
MQQKQIKNKFFDTIDTVSFTIIFLFSLIYFMRQENVTFNMALIGFICVGLGLIGSGLIAYMAQPILYRENKKRSYYLIRCGLGFSFVLIFGIIYNIAKFFT